MSRGKGGGRPTVMTKEVIAKLEDSFKHGLSDRLACIDAGISEDSLYEYCKRNPKFSERKELLKDTPNIVAHKRLADDAAATPGARWWAERKMPEFMPKTKLEHGGKIETTNPESHEALREVAVKFEAELRQAIIDGRKAKK